LNTRRDIHRAVGGGGFPDGDGTRAAGESDAAAAKRQDAGVGAGTVGAEIGGAGGVEGEGFGRLGGIQGDVLGTVDTRDVEEEIVGGTERPASFFPAAGFTRGGFAHPGSR
jgi:hypothetical protein